MRFASFASSLALGISLMALAPQALAAGQPGPTLLTADQGRIDEVASTLVKDPQVIAARNAVLQEWSALPPAQFADGKSHLAGAVDELVYFSVRTAVERKQFAPSVIWAIAAPYKKGSATISGSRWGIDDPDRIYRSATVDPALSYVVHGQRSSRPSNDDFLFEATGSNLKTIGSLPARDIDVSSDGSFTITVDATPANGRRNHLTLPVNANGLLIRDTLADWTKQLPNHLTIEVVGGAAPKPASLDETRAEALSLIGVFSQFDAQLIGQISKPPVNQLIPVVRTLESGVEGAIVGTSRFSIKNDEALVLTIDGQGAGYIGLELTDPWARSLPYWDSLGSLSNLQTKPNADGTITYIISPREPGFYNWLSTAGLNDGFFALRVENFAKVDVAKVVRSAKLVKLYQLVEALPADAVRVTPAQRTQELAERKAGYAKRLTN